MKRLTVIILAALFAGCYTQLQIPEREAAYAPPLIVIIEPIYPYPPPTDPCPPPRPHLPGYPIVVQPAEPVAAPPAKNDRIRTDGSTRDERTQADRGGRRR